MITVYHLQEVLFISLVANPDKFQTMFVQSNNIDDIDLNVTAENVSLPPWDTMKVLGIDIDNRLTFDGHVSSMCIKAGKQLNALQRLKGSLDQDSRMAYIRVLSCLILIIVTLFGCLLVRCRFLN